MLIISHWIYGNPHINSFHISSNITTLTPHACKKKKTSQQVKPDFEASDLSQSPITVITCISEPLKLSDLPFWGHLIPASRETPKGCLWFPNFHWYSVSKTLNDPWVGVHLLFLDKAPRHIRWHKLQFAWLYDSWTNASIQKTLSERDYMLNLCAVTKRLPTEKASVFKFDMKNYWNSCVKMRKKEIKVVTIAI